jgi:hypothetical protein
VEIKYDSLRGGCGALRGGSVKMSMAGVGSFL